MAFLGFCIFLSAAVVCDAWMFMSGYNAIFFKVKTEEEKALRAATIKQKLGNQPRGE